MDENRTLLNDFIDKYAKESGKSTAIIQHDDGRKITYSFFKKMIEFFALKLLDMGVKKGDRVASQLVLIPEHMAIMYACFKIGAVFAPLDVRLQENEVVRDINKIEAKLFFFLGNTSVKDFRKVGEMVKKECKSVTSLVQFTPNAKGDDLVKGAISITDMMDKKRLLYLKLRDLFTGRLNRLSKKHDKRDPALIIYTTGTTGEPKPAVLCHENILVQNRILERGIGYKGEREDFRVLVNLPPSHVGCITETFMTTLFMGGTAVFLRIFDVEETLKAIEKHKVKLIGQIPTMYRMLWNHPDYNKYDLSSLEFAAYAGSSVDTVFLKELSKMAPGFGTGLGMTENAGFATFTPFNIPIEEMAGQVGQAFSDLAQVTIRKPMTKEGFAGEELSDGETGEICYHPPIVFLGYYNQPEETKKAVSKEGILYTGDLGFFKRKDGYRALYLSGRSKFVIKQKGYNVFPGEVEEHIACMNGVNMVDVVGVKHRIFDEAIFAFVQPKPGIIIESSDVISHCRKIASYKRPLHVEILSENEEIPLTRSAKVDKLSLIKRAESVVEALRKDGKWDAS